MLVEAKIELILDDVGASASSLANLALLPISTIKLDHSFVATRPDDDASLILYRTAQFARGLELRVVAGGVETLDQLTTVVESGFPLAQGNLFSRPPSAPAIEKLVHRERPFATLLASRPARLDLARDDLQPPVSVGGRAAQ